MMSIEIYNTKFTSENIDLKENDIISNEIKKKIKDAVQESKSQLVREKKNLKNHKKGFGSMSQAKIEEIAKKGGKARAAQLGHDGFVALGRKGGKTRVAQLGHDGFVELGRKGGKARVNYQNQKTTSSQQDISSSITLNKNFISMKPNEEISQSFNNLKKNLIKHSINTKKNKERAA